MSLNAIKNAAVQQWPTLANFLPDTHHTQAVQVAKRFKCSAADLTRVGEIRDDRSYYVLRRQEKPDLFLKIYDRGSDKVVQKEQRSAAYFANSGLAPPTEKLPPRLCTIAGEYWPQDGKEITREDVHERSSQARAEIVDFIQAVRAVKGSMPSAADDEKHPRNFTDVTKSRLPQLRRKGLDSPIELDSLDKRLGYVDAELAAKPWDLSHSHGNLALKKFVRRPEDGKLCAIGWRDAEEGPEAEEVVRAEFTWKLGMDSLDGLWQQVNPHTPLTEDKRRELTLRADAQHMDYYSGARLAERGDTRNIDDLVYRCKQDEQRLQELPTLTISENTTASCTGRLLNFFRTVGQRLDESDWFLTSNATFS